MTSSEFASSVSKVVGDTGCPKKKHSFKIFGFGLFVVFWTPLETDLDTFGLFGQFWTLLDSLDAF